MKIVITSVLVDDQDKALAFYTNVLGFVKKTEVPMGAHRWLTVVSPDDSGGTELRYPLPSSPRSTALNLDASRRAQPVVFLEHRHERFVR
jgi:catechol 2,3-dioxygenase-like lactoylglutathione lyase family enzyme